MIPRRMRLPLFSLVCLVQLAVPGKMIVDREWTLANGDVYRFRTAPVDPYDAFRGRYVALDIAENSVTDSRSFQRGQRVYAVLDVDDDGFAGLSRIETEPPTGEPYVKVKVGFRDGPGEVRLEVPFDRYYMEETLAPEAERAYREHSRREQVDAFITVRVRNGRAVLEELFVAGVPIREYLESQ